MLEPSITDTPLARRKLPRKRGRSLARVARRAERRRARKFLARYFPQFENHRSIMLRSVPPVVQVCFLGSPPTLAPPWARYSGRRRQVHDVVGLGGTSWLFSEAFSGPRVYEKMH